MQKKRIGEILITNGLITKKILEEALADQQQFGGNVTQYLIAHGYLSEEDLAKCISIQFGYPYLPLRAYDIPEDIVKLVSGAIAERHWLMPVDKIENIITVVMADPFDEDAINEVERMTSCKVQPFVGVLSDILRAIEKYYGINIGLEDLKKNRKASPLSVTGGGYKGVERRKGVRIKAKIEMHFPLQDAYKKSETKDISTQGLLFESPNMLPVGSFIVLEIDLPRHISAYPIPAVVQVVRAVETANGRYDIGVKIIKIAKEDLDNIMKCALNATKGL